MSSANIKKDGMAPKEQVSLVSKRVAKSKARISSTPAQISSPATEPEGRPFRDAVLKLIAEDPTLPESAAQAIFKKACNGDLRAFTTLRDMTEGKPGRQAKKDQTNATPKYEDVSVIEIRILELLQRSPELLARLDQARKKAIRHN